MAYRQLRQGPRSSPINSLGRSLLWGACLLGFLIAVPPEGFSQPPAAQASKKPSARELLARARTLETKKQYEQAAAAYREYLAVRPKDDKAVASLAQVLVLQGGFAEAAGLYEGLVARHPESIDHQLGLARIKSRQSNFAEAQPLYERVLSKAPGNLEAQRGLADALLAGGQQAPALQRYEALYDATKDPDVAEQIAKVKAALEKSAAAPAAPPEAAPPPPSPEQLLERARALDAAKQYAAAAVAYEGYLRIRPAGDDVRRSLARALFLEGRFSEAATTYEQVLSRRPSDVKALLGLANVLSWQKKPGPALSRYEEVIKIDPRNLEARRGAADILYWQGEYALALPQYEAIFSATQDPKAGQRIREIRGERLWSPRAPVGKVSQVQTLPYRDYAKFGFSYYSYSQGVPVERDGMLEVAKSLGEQTLVGRLQVLNRFGFDDVPVSAELDSPLWKKAWGALSFSVAANPNFVPNYRLGGQVFQDLGLLHESLSFLEASLGLERLSYAYRAETSRTLFIPAQDVTLMTPSLTVYLPFNVWLTEKVYYVPDTGSMTLSSQLTWRPTDRIQLHASGAFGTSGEQIYAFQDFKRADTRSFQGGAIVPLTSQFSAELLGFYEDRASLYVRRGGTFNLIWHW